MGTSNYSTGLGQVYDYWQILGTWTLRQSCVLGDCASKGHSHKKRAGRQVLGKASGSWHYIMCSVRPCISLESIELLAKRLPKRNLSWLP